MAYIDVVVSGLIVDNKRGLTIVPVTLWMVRNCWCLEEFYGVGRVFAW